MAQNDYDSYPENEWDDGWESTLNEFDWERYLKNEYGEIERYRALYAKHAESLNRLEDVAWHMGWSVAEPEPQETPDDSIDTDSQNQAPYTVHKHPLFIASRALHEWLSDEWRAYVTVCSELVTPTQAIELQTTYSQSDQYGLMAVNALDLGDFALAVAYFKRGMAHINTAHAQLAQIESLDIPPLDRYCSKARQRLFDIREIWLRIIADCRQAVANRLDED